MLVVLIQEYIKSKKRPQAPEEQSTSSYLGGGTSFACQGTSTREAAKGPQSFTPFPCPFLAKSHPCLFIILLSGGQKYNK